MTIRNFKDDATADIAREVKSKKARKRLPVKLHDIAYRKLVFLENAHELGDLIEWQSLRLEKLKGNRQGQYSIRVNDQYRICFGWDSREAYDVEIVDYH